MFQFLVGIKMCRNYHQEFRNGIKHLGSVHSYFPCPTLPHLLFSFLRIAETVVMLPNSGYDLKGQKVAKLICNSNTKKAEEGVIYRLRDRIIA